MPHGRKFPERLLLIRHGAAEGAAPDGTDASRALTAAGVKELEAIAPAIIRAFPDADAIYASPFLRARQTAAIVALASEARLAVQLSEALVPDADPETLCELLSQSRAKRVIVVGHEPNLHAAVLELIGAGSDAAIDFDRGGCFCVRLSNAGRGVLEWMLSRR